MSNFTVIEGGGPPNWNPELASQALRLVIVELLRSTVHGSANEDRIRFDVFFEWLSKAGALERNEDRSNPFVSRFLSATRQHRLNLIVRDAVAVMYPQLTSARRELEKQLTSKDRETSDPEWFIRDSLDIEDIILRASRRYSKLGRLTRMLAGALSIGAIQSAACVAYRKPLDAHGARG